MCPASAARSRCMPPTPRRSRLSTTSGAIGGSVRTEQLEIDSVSGCVELMLDVLPAKLEAETTSGDVTLTLPAQPDVPVCIVTRTVSGQLPQRGGQYT